METTFKKVIEFKNAADLYLTHFGQEDEDKKTKLQKAIENVTDQLEDPLNDYNRKLKKAQRKHALEGKDMAILREANGAYKYNKKGEADLDEEVEQLLDHECEFDIDPEIVAEVPADTHRDYMKKFMGFVVDKNTIKAKPKAE